MGIATLRDVLDRLLGRPPRPRAFRPNRWSIEEVERRIRREPMEWAFVFDALGRQAIRRRGTRRVVAFAAHELPMLADSTVVHNHPVEAGIPPESQTFSRLDLALAIRYDIAAMRVVSDGWRFVMERPVDGWPADEDVMLTVYNEMSEELFVEFAARRSQRMLTWDDIDAELPDAILRRLAAWGGFEYRRERLP